MTDTQWKVFEVFHQQARGEPHVHVGSVHAPDAEMPIVVQSSFTLIRLETLYDRIS